MHRTMPGVTPERPMMEDLATAAMADLMGAAGITEDSVFLGLS